MMFAIIFYSLAAIALVGSFIADRERTVAALKKAWKALTGILPEFVLVILSTGLVLSFLDHEFVLRVIGSESGVLGVFVASIVGAVTLIPGFVAFPLAALLREQGAGLLQIAAFVSALMMVGVVTFPLEKRTFGTRIALTRNLLAFAFSIVVAGILSIVLGALR